MTRSAPDVARSSSSPTWPSRPSGRRSAGGSVSRWSTLDRCALDDVCVRVARHMSTQVKAAPGGSSRLARLIHHLGFADEADFILRVVQPALVGLIDGTVSSLAPIFAAAVAANSR